MSLIPADLLGMGAQAEAEWEWKNRAVATPDAALTRVAIRATLARPVSRQRRPRTADKGADKGATGGVLSIDNDGGGDSGGIHDAIADGTADNGISDGGGEEGALVAAVRREGISADDVDEDGGGLRAQLERGNPEWQAARTLGWRRDSYKIEAKKMIHKHVTPEFALSMGPTARRLSTAPLMRPAEFARAQEAYFRQLKKRETAQLMKDYKKHRGGPQTSVMAKTYVKRMQTDVRSEIRDSLAKREAEKRARHERIATAKRKAVEAKAAAKKPKDPWAGFGGAPMASPGGGRRRG